MRKPHLEVLLKVFSAHVLVPAANLTRKFLTESVQLVQPVRNRLPVPTQGQLERVVNLLLLVILLFTSVTVRVDGSEFNDGFDQFEFPLSRRQG